MNARIVFYIIISVLILVIGGWAYFFYFPYVSVINAEKEKISKIKDQIKRSTKVGMDLDEIKNRLYNIKDELERYERKIITQSDLDNVAQMLSREMQRYNIKVLNISPLISHFLKLNKKTEVSKLPIEVNVESKYLNFGRFLDNIYNLPIYIYPEAISINRINPKDNLLAITFTISVYIKSET